MIEQPLVPEPTPPVRDPSPTPRPPDPIDEPPPDIKPVPPPDILPPAEPPLPASTRTRELRADDENDVAREPDRPSASRWQSSDNKRSLTFVTHRELAFILLSCFSED
jgi:hypothetical protein